MKHGRGVRAGSIMWCMGGSVMGLYGGAEASCWEEGNVYCTSEAYIGMLKRAA